MVRNGIVLTLLFLMAMPLAAERRVLRAAEPIASSYIVDLDAQASDAEVEAFIGRVERMGGAVARRFHSVRALTLDISDEAAEALADDPLVVRVQQNGILRQEAAPRTKSPWLASNATTINFPAQWAYDRIDQRYLPLDNKYTYGTTGQGVHIYVVDSGINYDHIGLAGQVDRVTYEWAGGSRNFSPDKAATDIQDCYGHGSGIAALAASIDGIARDATLHAVRVMDCNGATTPDLIRAGLDWVATYGKKPAVVNLSSNFRCILTTPGQWNCDQYSGLEQSVNAVVGKGMVVVVSAGNLGETSFYADAAANVPGRITTPGVIVVGASVIQGSPQYDARAPYSSYGASVDLYAPGGSVATGQLLCAKPYPATSGSNWCSGTSFAAPLVTGFAAQIMQQSPGLTPASYETIIRNNATTNLLANVPAGANRLLYTR